MPSMFDKIPSFDSLPVADMNDTFQDVRRAREKLKATFNIVNGILSYSGGVPAAFRRGLLNVRFHVLSGLALADDYLSKGYLPTDNMMDVPGLEAAINSQIGAIRKARPYWKMWVDSEKAIGIGKSLPATTAKNSSISTVTAKKTAVSGFGEDESAQPSVFGNIGKPTPFITYLGIAFLGGVTLLAWNVFFKS